MGADWFMALQIIDPGKEKAIEAVSARWLC
jgi:hypothetical protein